MKMHEAIARAEDREDLDEREVKSADTLSAEAKLKMATEMLAAVEHVKLPGMTISRCPVCLSPHDMSEPHERGCKLAAALAELVDATGGTS